MPNLSVLCYWADDCWDIHIKFLPFNSIYEQLCELSLIFQTYMKPININEQFMGLKDNYV